MVAKNLLLSIASIIFLSACNKWEKEHPSEIKDNCVTGISHKKVLLIGVDGCRTDALLAAATPAFDSLMAHAYVNLHTDRGPYTVSAPGWSTILHAVYPDKHGVTSNDLSALNYGSYYDFFYYMRMHNPAFSLGMISNWENFLLLTTSEDYAQIAKTDKEVKIKALDFINQCSPDVLLLHFDDVDHAGHYEGGFSPNNVKYIEAIERTAGHVTDLMNVIKQREQSLGEEWLVVVVTDHGGSGTSHSNQDNLEETRYVFSILRLPNMNRIDLPAVSNADIAPTILKYMNVPIDSAWQFDGQVLF